MFNEQLVLMLPAAVYSLSTGCPPFWQWNGVSEEFNGAVNDWVKVIWHGGMVYACIHTSYH